MRSFAGALPELAFDLSLELRATGRGDAQNATLLSLAQLGRIVRVILTLAVNRDVGGPLQEVHGEAAGALEFERPRARPVHRFRHPEPVARRLRKAHTARQQEDGPSPGQT